MPKQEELTSSINKLFSKLPTFMLSVARLEQLPSSDKNEIAFAGRSNVGKSSLINALFNTKNLAKTSSTPGRTQQLNYFNFLNQIYLVDLPGYGYAKAPQTEVKRWQNILLSYLKGRVNLRRVFVLVDSRIGLKSNDDEILKQLDDAAVSYQIILTKIDKISTSALLDLEKNIEKKLEKHPAAHTKILKTSAEKKVGLESVQEEIASFLEEFS